MCSWYKEHIAVPAILLTILTINIADITSKTLVTATYFFRVDIDFERVCTCLESP